MTVTVEPSRWLVAIASHAPPGALLEIGDGADGIGEEAARCTGRSLQRLDVSAAALGRQFPLVLVAPATTDEVADALAVGLGRLHPAGHLIVRVDEEEADRVARDLLPTLTTGALKWCVLDVRPCRTGKVLVHIGRAAVN